MYKWVFIGNLPTGEAIYTGTNGAYAVERDNCMLCEPTAEDLTMINLTLKRYEPIVREQCDDAPNSTSICAALRQANREKDELIARMIDDSAAERRKYDSEARMLYRLIGQHRCNERLSCSEHCFCWMAEIFLEDTGRKIS